jgi:hypothetical protein
MRELDKEIIKNHKQIYNLSCIPSCVEMILKLLGKVDINFYSLQNDWNDKSDGSFNDFDGYKFENILFSHEFSSSRGEAFPFKKLYDRIDTLLLCGFYICVSIRNLYGYHMYIIYEKIGNEYWAFSKKSNSEEILELINVKEIIYLMGGTDLLTYSII